MSTASETENVSAFHTDLVIDIVVPSRIGKRGIAIDREKATHQLMRWYRELHVV
jgi:hypothetical protein